MNKREHNNMAFVFLAILIVVWSYLIYNIVKTKKNKQQGEPPPKITRLNWEVHRKMTTDDTEKHGDGTFDNFIQQFTNHNWLRSERHKDSLFTLDHKGWIHAGIIKFDGVGMTMKTFEDYVKVMEYVDFYLNKEDGVCDWNFHNKLREVQQ
jgi:hypothetical protein